MGVVIRVDYPVDSDINQVIIQTSSASTGSFGDISGSPFNAKTNGIYILEFDHGDGAYNIWYRLAFVDELGTTGSFSEAFQPEGPPYCSARDVWDWLNVAERKRGEVLGSGVTSSTFFSLSHSNVVEGTYEFKYGSDVNTSTELVESDDYYLDLDDGYLKLTSAGFSKVSGSNLYANYSVGLMKNSVIRNFIRTATKQVETETKMKWYRQRSTEYLDVDNDRNRFYLKNFPVISVSSLRVNNNSQDGVEDWVTLSAGFSADYVMADYDKMIGRFDIFDNLPKDGQRRVEVVYDHGYDTVPANVRRLAVLYAVKDLLLNPVIAGSMIKGQDTFNVVRASDGVEREISRVVSGLTKHRYEMI